MKKLTLMLASLLLSVGSAFADQLVADGVYTIQGGDSSGHRGYLAAGVNYADYPVLSEIGWTTHSGNSTEAIENGKLWYVTSKNDGETYIIYNVGLGKFLSGEDGQVNFSATPYQWEIVENTQSGTTYTSIKYVSFACGSAPRNVNYHWQAADGGSCHTFAEEADGLTTYATQVAAAETVINPLNSTAELSNTIVYTISTADRGSWVSNGVSLTSTVKAGVDADATSEKQQFAFLRTDNTPEGEYYIYSIADKKFVTKYGCYTFFTDEALMPVKFLDSPSATCKWVIAFNGANHIGISNGFNPAVITHYNDLNDGGNQVKVFVAKMNVDNQAALDKIDSPYTMVQLPGSGLESVTELEAGKKYLIYDAHSNRYGFHYEFKHNGDDASEILKKAIDLNSTEVLDKNYVWTVEADGDNWKIRNDFSGRYANAVTKSNNNGVGDTGEAFSITYDATNAAFTIQNTSDSYYWNGNDVNLAGWDDAHPMKFIEVTDAMQKQFCDLTINFSEEFCGYSCCVSQTVEVGSTVDSFIPAFYDVAEDAVYDKDIAGKRTVTLDGSWTFPFELDKVYRAKNHAGNNSDFTNFFYEVNTKKILTKNFTDDAAFVPERLIYLTSTGFDSNGNLQVVLRNVLAEENTGFNTATGSNSNGSFSTSPTTFLVATNSTDATNGFSLRHSSSASSYVNAYQGTSELGTWNDASSAQNDSGSCIRFYALTDEDFDGLLNGDNARFVTEEKVNTAKASHSAADVRALFADYNAYKYSIVDANATVAGLDGYTAEHFGDDLGYFSGTTYEAIVQAVTAYQTAINAEEEDVDAVKAAIDALNEEVAKVTLNLPEVDKYYRFKGYDGGWYITPESDNGQMAMSETASDKSAFYFEAVEGSENTFVVKSYYYDGAGISNTHSLSPTGTETYTFYPSESKYVGAYTIKSNSTGSQYVYNNYDVKQKVDRNGGYAVRCNWILEETSKPATTVGIEEVGVAENAGQTIIYDLQGRRLSAPVKGINIINGKKVLVK